MASYDLDNQIKIGNVDFNVNAVYSAEAGKVSNKLAITEARFEKEDGVFKTTESTFDGSAAKSISVVSSAGGEFSGPIRAANPIKTGDTYDDTDILNYECVQALVAELNGVPLLLWDGEALKSVTVADVDGISIKPIYIIIGTSEDREALNGHSAEPEYYIYLCTDDGGNIFLKTASGYNQLATDATKATSAEKIINTANESECFDYSRLAAIWRDIYANATGNEGEFGAGILHTLAVQVERSDDFANRIDTLENWKTAISSTVEGREDSVKHALSAIEADKADMADMADKATADSDGVQINTGYYQSTNRQQINKIQILSSTEVSTKGGISMIQGVLGDILIVY